MNLLDLITVETPKAEPRRPSAPAARADEGRHALVAQLGGEVAAALTAALERVNVLATTGRIDRASLVALRDEVALARRIGIMGQQLSRLGSGSVQRGQERLDLTATLRETLLQRGREMEARGTEVLQELQAATVECDATLLYSLLQVLLDWSFEHAIGRIDLSIDHKSWPAHARLHCAFVHRPQDEVDSGMMPLDGGAALAIDTISWHLLQQTAAVMGLLIERRDTAVRTRLSIEFPRTVRDHLDEPSSAAEQLEAMQGINSRPLAGSHVLVIAPRREIRNLVREATRAMGLMIDYVSSIDEARTFCAGGMPHAVVHESTLGIEAFERLRRELLASVPMLAFIQIAEQGKAFQVVNVGGRQFASVGRDAVIESLPAALLFELARCG